MANDMQAFIEAIQHIVSRPENSRAIVDEAIRRVQQAGQNVRALATTIQIANSLSTPREAALSEIGRLLFLEMLNQHVKYIKQHAMSRFNVTGLGVVGSGNWVLHRLQPVRAQASEIESNLRRLSAIDGLDAAIYATVAARVGRVATSSLEAALATNDAPDHFGKNIDGFLLYAENHVVWTILWTTARRYARIRPFNLSTALVDLSNELTANLLQSVLRTGELTRIYASDPQSPALKAYYQALFRQIAARA